MSISTDVDLVNQDAGDDDALTHSLYGVPVVVIYHLCGLTTGTSPADG